MAKKKQVHTLASLSAEVAALKAELHALKLATAMPQVVKATVDGPRRSEIAVDAQSIPMSGEFKRTGKGSVKLEPPTVAVDVVARGQIGTNTTVTIEINDKTKEESFVLTKEHERKSFDFPFSDFDL